MSSMKRTNSTVTPAASVAPLMLATLVAAGVLAGAVEAFGQSDSARYQLTFVATWSERSHPTDFPGAAHFSPLIAASHSDQVSFWSEGAPASPGIESMAELGASGILGGEVAVAITDGTAGSLVTGNGIGSSPGQEAIEITVTQEHPRVTAVSMIAPSPDWFVGVSGENLLEEGKWADQRVVRLFALDAGTDSGTSYLAANVDTVPRQPIRQLEGVPFLGVPVGHLIFRRLDGAELPVLSLRDGRFHATTVWGTPEGGRGVGQPTQITSDTGYFWFFQPSNTEVLVKVLQGCFFNEHYWVFAGGLTNVEVHLVVEDTGTGELRGYLNPLGVSFRPIQDTAALKTCP